MRVNQVYFLFALLIASFGSYAQTITTPVLDLSVAQEYRIGGITVVGAEYTDVQAVKLFSALQIGTNVTIPGDQIGRAITNLWDQDLFSNISIEAAELIDRDVISLLE